ncbi:MAG TPA: carbon-nitrogen hydrolase family protein, partial [Arthrobacter sp.]|nr:carbon-nitrogen hydrolase family protein [Arthrobacter sp.]
MNLTVGTVAENFGRDLEENYATIGRLIEEARGQGVQLLALPEAAIGGYLSALGNHGDKKLAADSLPPALSLDGPEIRRVIDMAGNMVVCIGFCEADGDTRYNTAVALDGSGILGHY